MNITCKVVKNEVSVDMHVSRYAKIVEELRLEVIHWSHLTLNSHEWPRQNFSLQYQHNINQISDENKEKYQFGDNKLIQY